ncbi:hypothetical protein TSEDIMI_10021 [Tenacibaculum sediminilitoris]|uniref:hypothetical protein n=1 Tax=Tenacibaculum sediminilitoris TaxID=1820334 RepID=UPI0038963BB2
MLFSSIKVTKNKDCNPARGTVLLVNLGFKNINKIRENTKDEEKIIKKVKVGKPIANTVKNIRSPNPIVSNNLFLNPNLVYRYKIRNIIIKTLIFSKIEFKKMLTSEEC